MSELFLRSKTKWNWNFSRQLMWKHGIFPEWLLIIFIASFGLAFFPCRMETEAFKWCFPWRCGRGWALAAWRHQLCSEASFPMEEVGGGSPTLAPKIKSSPSTRDFKLCFKAKQHPWARDVGFYLGPFCRSYRRSCLQTTLQVELD